VVFVDPAIGVPCPMLIQWPDRFYHSSHDTPDKCDPRSLALAARCAAAYAGFVAGAGASEHAWLAALVARHARRCILEALDGPEPARGVAFEVVRGRRAISSLGRLGLASSALSAARGELEAFARREAAWEETKPRAPRRADVLAPPRIPRRSIPAPLGFPRRLLPGEAELPPEVREAWRRRELETPDAYVTSELAWLACDGRRTLEDIAHLVWLETGREASDYLAAFFDLTTRLGVSDWIAAEEVACNPSAPGTAGL
jgi:hypothetical protein